jgi:hypothetical protein
MFFLRRQWLRERATILRLFYVVWIVFFLSVYPFTCSAFGLLLVPIMQRLCSAVRTCLINRLVSRCLLCTDLSVQCDRSVRFYLYINLYLYIFHLYLYNKGCVRLKSYIHFIRPLCFLIMLLLVLSNAICSVLTTFPVFCICCVVLHLHAADLEVTWPIKCVIIYLSPLSLKIIVCPLFKAQRTQYEPPVTVPTICGLCFA